MIESQVDFIKKAKQSSKEEFLEQHPNHGDIWELLQNSKEGYITIKKVSDNPGYLSAGEGQRGYTPAFGEGLSLYIDNISSYYYTSVIQSINWEDNTFKTMNSIYKFKFDECKNQETE